MLCVAALGGVRIARCLHERLRQRPLAARSVLLVGGRDSAERFLLDRTRPARRDCRVIGLVTDGLSSLGRRIHGVPIVGGLEQLPEIVKSLSPEEIVVLASGLPAAQRAESIRTCRASGRPVKVVPDLDDILRRDLSVLRMWQPQAEDILFRAPVPLDLARVGACFRGRRVLVTGAGGSIGSEICRQIAACSPARLAMFEIHEESLYHIDREVRREYPEVAADSIIGDVRDVGAPASRVCNRCGPISCSTPPPTSTCR
jgi:FlaA1/EpsC-like NDP-sugar epimerase